MRRGGEAICLVREDGSFPLRSHVLHEGIRFPLGVAAAGLVILSFLPDDEVDRFMKKRSLVLEFGPSHQAEEIRERIRSTRKKGPCTQSRTHRSGELGNGGGSLPRRRVTHRRTEHCGHRATLLFRAPKDTRATAETCGVRLYEATISSFRLSSVPNFTTGSK